MVRPGSKLTPNNLRLLNLNLGTNFMQYAKLIHYNRGVDCILILWMYHDKTADLVLPISALYLPLDFACSHYL